MQTKIRKSFRRLTDWFSPVRVFASVLLLLAFLIGILGYLTKYSDLSFGNWIVIENILEDFYANITVDCISVSIAILVIDVLYEDRENKKLKAQLVREVAVPDNGIALRALEEIRLNGWLQEDILKGAFLVKANLANVNLRECNLEGARLSKAILLEADLYKINLSKADLEDANLSKSKLSFARLQNATLMGANLQNADLWKATLNFASAFEANLKGTKLTIEQLITLNSLCSAIMPDGSEYDGRFNLPGDLVYAAEIGYDVSDPKDMAFCYQVDIKTYIEGQKWAIANHPEKWLKLNRGKLQIDFSKSEILTFTGKIKFYFEKVIRMNENIFLITSKSLIPSNLNTEMYIKVEAVKLRDNVFFVKRVVI